MYAYSKTTNAFYLLESKASYLLAGTWPPDAEEVTDDIANEFVFTTRVGKVRVAGNDGLPAWVDIPPLSDIEKLIIAEGKKDNLLAEATQKITVWQTKLLMGRKLTSAESTSLNLLMDYIDDLEAVDTSTASSTSQISWPAPPAI
ncbi:tail fiber assembly protein [Erwinia rhapontici]|uniref:tail fiber assembly protein n=1 Tax=Erwinia rhapontici TaxID=55212 RepID=UPI00143865AF|nr:tail fiber assembly protein [Erwinia rhapontici]NKG32131.1 tail fiber assembly protein [Erwinia rhapontici]